jgi:hypothetical protein
MNRYCDTGCFRETFTVPTPLEHLSWNFSPQNEVYEDISLLGVVEDANVDVVL